MNSNFSNASSFLFENDHVSTWAHQTQLFSKQECESIIQYANLNCKFNALVGNNNLDENIRKSDINWFYRGHETSYIYEKISNAIKNLNEQFFKFDLIGFCEAMQFSEYKSPGGHYSKHIDQTYKNQVRKLSVVLQLSDPNNYEGGDLEIYISDNPQTMIKEQGSLILFPSYVLHKVNPVTKGTRYSLVSWISGPNFK